MRRPTSDHDMHPTMYILGSVLIGAVAGWLAGLIAREKGFRLLLDILLGIVGGFVGGWLLGVTHLGLSGTWTGTAISSAIGAVALLIVSRLVKE